MISIPAAVAVFVIHEPVSFGCGIDGMRGHCKRILQKDPISAGYFLFVNKKRNQARVIWYDGQGFLLCTKRLSKGSFRNWPGAGECGFSLVEYFQAQGLIAGANPHEQCYGEIWKKVSPNLD
jgi:transposase